jgi:hypothetical protein
MIDKEGKYLVCRDYKSGEKMRCIFSVYKTGTYDINDNQVGIDYAAEISKVYTKWQTNFCNNQVKPVIKEEPLNIKGKAKEAVKAVVKLEVKDFVRNYGSGEIAGSNYEIFAGRGSSNEKSMEIFNAASGFIGQDTIRYGCTGSTKQCKDFVCARFVSNALRAAGVNIQIKDVVLGLEKEILDKGGVKIYDKSKDGVLNPNTNLYQVVNPGYIGVFYSPRNSNSGFHIVVLSGYDPKAQRILYIHDGGANYPVSGGRNSINNLYRVYKIG